MSLYDILLAAEVTIGTLVFVFVPLVAQLAHEEKIFLTRDDIWWIKVDSIVLLIGIFLLVSAVYLENEHKPIIEAFSSAVPSWILVVIPLILVAVFCLSVVITFRIGYLLLVRI